MHNSLGAREVGQYPISIATSLALESLMGIHPDYSPPKPPVVGYQEIWINVRTLIRNMVGACTKELHSEIPDADYPAELSAEMDTIEHVLQEANPKLQIIYYVSDYADIAIRLPGASLRRIEAAKNPKALTRTEFLYFQAETITELTKNYVGSRIRHFKGAVMCGSPGLKRIVISHITYDLANMSYGSWLLAESHTGKLKLPGEWYTKYFQGKELPMIPFLLAFLPIFGDSEMFKPMDHRLRKAIVDIAIAKKWNQVTTLDKIRTNLKQQLTSEHWDMVSVYI